MAVIRRVIDLSDAEYFCNKSWTISFNVNTKSWISFHSYLPNWYIAENNFYYSGLNGCCDIFDFVAFNTIPVGPTTTTTTTPYITTSTTTTIGTGCNFTGVITRTYCDLSGEAVIIVPPVCKRPSNLTTFEFIKGYTNILDSVYTDSTVSSIAACEAEVKYNAIPDGDESPIHEFASTLCSAIDINFGRTIYKGNTGTDCTVIDDGWYFTDELSEDNMVIQVANGKIVEMLYCIEPTSTTTTSSTTNALVCSTYTASKLTAGEATFNYKDCNGVDQTKIVGNATGGVSTVTFCASSVLSFSGGITITYNGPC
jgi:hypothetical protein